MKVNYVFLLVALLTIPFCTSQLYSCADKGLFYDNYELKAKDGELISAYNDVASCATLRTESNDGVCCYIKLKIENTLYDETFTQKGCHEVKLAEYLVQGDDFDFDNIIDMVEKGITDNKDNKNIEIEKVSIDCSSQFIHLVGISLLFLLL